VSIKTYNVRKCCRDNVSQGARLGLALGFLETHRINDTRKKLQKICCKKFAEKNWQKLRLTKKFKCHIIFVIAVLYNEKFIKQPLFINNKFLFNRRF
jgi:hypothetical protein